MRITCGQCRRLSVLGVSVAFCHCRTAKKGPGPVDEQPPQRLTIQDKVKINNAKADLLGLKDPVKYHEEQAQRIRELGLNVDVAAIRQQLGRKFGNLSFGWSTLTPTMSALEYMWPESCLAWLPPSLGPAGRKASAKSVLEFAERPLRTYPGTFEPYTGQLTADGLRRLFDLCETRRHMQCNNQYLIKWQNTEKILMWLIEQPVWPLWLAAWFGPRHKRDSPSSLPIWLTDSKPAPRPMHTAAHASTPPNLYVASKKRLGALYADKTVCVPVQL
ncbi:hypothetical protein JKP88DRAFT_246023 [Tribonema minus]|uniref:Uncharacterized protein n=1 Tax=Tribonema minus TaxID=303371 RepID=A0A836CDP5_9STRA|nr:hypothetical protein JKP88DRAFT_246023 [Tribonema minus]